MAYRAGPATDVFEIGERGMTDEAKGHRVDTASGAVTQNSGEGPVPTWLPGIDPVPVIGFPSPTTLQFSIVSYGTAAIWGPRILQRP
jgi:hypothetical protein